MHSMIPPRSITASIWVQFMFAFDLIYTAFIVPINVVFCYHDFGDMNTTCTHLGIFGSLIYIINMIMGFLMGAVLISGGIKKVETLNRRAVTKAYIHYGTFLIDLISVIPSLLILSIFSGATLPFCSSAVQLVRVIRVVKLFEILYLDASSGRLKDILRKGVGGAAGSAYMLVVIYLVFFVINLEACVLLLSAYYNGFDHSWISTGPSIPIETIESSKVVQWYQAFFMCFMTSINMSSWGFLPSSWVDMILCNLYQIIGEVMFIFFLSQVIRYVTTVSSEVQKFSMTTAKLKRVNEFIQHHDLPDSAAEELKVRLSCEPVCLFHD